MNLKMLVSANTQTAAASTTEAAVQTQCGASLHEAPVAASVNVAPVPQLPAGFWPLGGSTPVRMDESLPAEEETPAAEVDTTYISSFSASFCSTHQDDSAGVLTGVEEPLHAERKFIVFESSLRELFANCSACGQALGNLNFSVVGTLVVVEGVCEQQHKLQWRSQPLVRGSGAGAGNLLLAAGMLYSGCVVAATIRCLNSIGVQTITERTFYNYRRAYLLPAVKQLFLQKQAVMVDALADLQVDLAGDGRCDSPGYSAKYLTYSVLAMQNGCILHTEQVQVGESPEVPNSVSMEKRGLAKCLTAVENLGIHISSLTTASPAFHQLKTIVDNPLLLRDIRRLSPEVQTFLLESFHSVLNCFAPKSNAFSEDGMQARTWLAVLHFNENAGRQQALTREGEERWKMKSSKPRRGHFTVAAVKEEPSYGM
ncbi:hypothetical protein MTO96_048836 [Rhipicephalus appendiculatus]